MKTSKKQGQINKPANKKQADSRHAYQRATRQLSLLLGDNQLGFLPGCN